MGGRFAGSIFFLKAGTAYSVEVSAADPGGVSGGSKTVKVSTRSQNFPTGGGKDYYVDPSGKDSNKGTASAPFATIAKAAGVAGPGDIVRVRPGVYRESVALKRSGKAKAYISFIADGVGVILSGADPRYDGAGSSELWRPESGQIFSTDPGTRTRYVGYDGIRLYHYRTREEFDEFICGEPGGWYQDESNNRLYVRLSSGDNPGDHSVQIAVLEAGFRLDGADYVLIDGFEVRDYGSYGLHFVNAGWNVIRNCSIHAMRSQIQMTEAGTEGNLVENCELWDTSIPDWPWAMTKGHDEEGAGVNSTGGRGNVIRGCDMHGLFDGLSPSYWDKLEDEAYNCDWDVYDNRIHYLRDDVIEPEGPCINFRFWNNWCYDLFVGMSLVPINVGPTYVLYNGWYNLTSTSIKGGTSTGLCYFYHNSVYSKYPATSAVSTRRFQSQVYRNNIFYGTGPALNLRGENSLNSDLDYNDWYTSDTRWFVVYTGTPHKRLATIGNERIYTLKELQAATGWEANGLYADPMYVCPDNGNLLLRSDSPVIDKGVRLPNINDSFVGDAPDMGAYERGSPARGPFPLGSRIR
jgi:hypothetical protein